MTGFDPTGASDEALVLEARDGRVRAFELLLDRHQGRVLRVLRLMGVAGQDREDVAQEVFLRVFRHLHSFRPGRPFVGWLYRVTVNAAHDWRGRRGRRLRGEAPLTAAAETADPAADASAAARHGELRRALEVAIGALSERERAVFVLRELEGLDTADVARSLRISSITVRRHLGRARRRLQHALADLDQEKSLAIERPAPSRGSY